MIVRSRRVLHGQIDILIGKSLLFRKSKQRQNCVWGFRASNVGALPGSRRVRDFAYTCGMLLYLSGMLLYLSPAAHARMPCVGEATARSCDARVR